MGDMKFNKRLTVGRLKEALKDIPDDVSVNVLNHDGDHTSNVYVWYENLETRKFVDLMGYKPFHKMTDEEKKKCGE